MDNLTELGTLIVVLGALLLCGALGLGGLLIYKFLNVFDRHAKTMFEKLKSDFYND